MKYTITEQLERNTLLNKYFKIKSVRSLKDEFFKNCIEGSTLDPYTSIEYLVKMAADECGISKGYRTVFFDFAWSILSANRQLWPDEDRDSGFTDLTNYIERHFPEQATILDSYDVSMMDKLDYFVEGMDLYMGEGIAEKPIFCYALHLFFYQYTDLEL